jgi:hypothetical protein
VIATRESRLALWQAEHVQALLQARGHEVGLLGMTTRGDQILDRSLSKVGGKGLFVKELEVALEEGRADLAVHSLKDVPMELPEGFILGCVMEREDPRDALVSNLYATLDELPPGSSVGAGDAMVAGVAVGLTRGWALSEAVRLGIAAGAAVHLTPGTAACTREDTERLFAQSAAPVALQPAR